MIFTDGDIRRAVAAGVDDPPRAALRRAVRCAALRRSDVRELQHADDHEEEGDQIVRDQKDSRRRLQRWPDVSGGRGRSDIWR